MQTSDAPAINRFGTEDQFRTETQELSANHPQKAQIQLNSIIETVIAPFIGYWLESWWMEQRHNAIYIWLTLNTEGESAFYQKTILQELISCLQKTEFKDFTQVRISAFCTWNPFPVWLEDLQRDYNQNWQILAPGTNLPIDQRSTFAAVSSRPSFVTQNQERQNQAREDASKPQITKTDHFLVCGLGSLGQYCVKNLQQFADQDYGIKVTAIDKTQPDSLDIENLDELLAQPLILGDCRDISVLENAGIQHCRAILLVTDNENVNIEAALVARRLNPHIHIVVRSSRPNLNQLLKENLEDFVALEPTELPAAAFAVASLGQDIRGFFRISNRHFRVIQRQVSEQENRFFNFPAYLVHKRSHRLLAMPQISDDHLFFQWQPDLRLGTSDVIAYVELVDLDHHPQSHQPTQDKKPSILGYITKFWRSVQKLRRSQGFLGIIKNVWHWINGEPMRRLISLVLFGAFCLWSTGTILLYNTIPNLPLERAISAGAILLLGGYGDVFGGLDGTLAPSWVLMVCFIITVISLLSVVGLLGLIADQLIASRFDFLRRTVSLPTSDHIILIGFGRVGQRVLSLLESFQQKIIVISQHHERPESLSHIPWLVGNPIECLENANLGTAKSVIALTEEPMLNLEIALIAKQATQRHQNTANIIVRTFNEAFSANIAGLLPESRAMCAYALSAEAFAGAAFGENMLSVFRLHGRTVLVAEYQIEAGDTLTGLSLAKVAYGYSVVPIYLHSATPKPDGKQEFWLPSDSERLHDGDRLVVLSSSAGLQRIERGQLNPPRLWRLRAKAPLNQNVLLELGNQLSNQTGCDLDSARKFANALPNEIDLMLYDSQAYRLGQTLIKLLPVSLLPY